MSIHPSLSSSEKNKKARSVMKRIERIRMMLDKGEWKQGDKIYGLPKIKTIRIKIKKEKAEKTETAATATEGAAASQGTAKEQPAKGTAAPKSQEKK